MKKVMFGFIMLLIAGTFGALIWNYPHVSMSPSAGSTYALQTGSTIWGMQQAVMSKVGTFILKNGENPSMFMFSWSCGDARCFSIMDVKAGREAVTNFLADFRKGTVMHTSDAKDVIDYMLAKGWQNAKPSDVPEPFRIALIESASWLVATASRLTTFVFLPTGAIDIYQYPTPVVQ